MKLKVNSEEHIIVVSYFKRTEEYKIVHFGLIKFNDSNFQEQRLDFCKENDVFNSELEIQDFYENEKAYLKHQQEVIDWQIKQECGND